jgi:hypothetical protein
MCSNCCYFVTVGVALLTFCELNAALKFVTYSYTAKKNCVQLEH